MNDWPLAPLQKGHYGAIVADPPWNFRVRSDKGKARSAERHYKVMNLRDIRAMPVEELCAKDCHLFLWATGPHLRQAFDVMTDWGFKYSGIAFTWIKLKRTYCTDQFTFAHQMDELMHVGMGYTTRKNTEMCLLGRRGSPKRMSKSVREVILEPVREHSRKPDAFRERVDEYVGDVPVAELFARSPHGNWDAWGNEVSKFDG